MILVGDVHVVSGPDIVPDVDTEMSDDAASSSNQTAITNSDDWIGETFLTWNHSRRKRNMGSNHRVRTYLDVTLVEDGGLWETDNAVFTEGAKSLPSRRVRAN